MEKYQFEILMWVNLSKEKAKLASSWYQGAGWYFNARDATGKVASCRCVAKSDQPTPVPASGQLEALNQCGMEGWSVAAFVPASPQSSVVRLLSTIPAIFGDDVSCEPNFILQRRLSS